MRERLTRQERRLVDRLSEAEGEYVAHDELLDAVYQGSYRPAEQRLALRNLVKRTRPKLSEGCVIKARRRIGYALTLEAAPDSPSSSRTQRRAGSASVRMSGALDIVLWSQRHCR